MELKEFCYDELISEINDIQERNPIVSVSYIGNSVFIAFGVENGGHHSYHWRPEQALGETVNTPDYYHLIRAVAKGDKQIHCNRKTKPRSNDSFRGKSVANDSAYNLTYAVGYKASR